MNAPLAGGAATRRERQHDEVVRLLLSDDPMADVLGREHLAEFPGDALVANFLTSNNLKGNPP